MSDEEYPDTVATHELKRRHQQKILGAEPQLITIEGVAHTLVLLATSDAFQSDEAIEGSMVLLAGTLLDECRSLRGRLYDD